jgi:hypothetical protein
MKSSPTDLVAVLHATKTQSKNIKNLLQLFEKFDIIIRKRIEYDIYGQKHTLIYNRRLFYEDN